MVHCQPAVEARSPPEVDPLVALGLEAGHRGFPAAAAHMIPTGQITDVRIGVHK